MKSRVSLDIIEKWLKGWSLSRELSLPIQYKSGFKVNVNDQKQKTRYVFVEPNEDFIELAKQINEPIVFLKVCASFDEFKNRIPSKWQVQPQGYMMTCVHKMNIPQRDLHDDFQLEYDHYNSTYVVKIVTKKGELASIGRIILVDDLAIYDRISTNDNYKRKGLATFLMKELEKIALSKNIYKNFLVATVEGKLLYEALGWELYSLYTSIVILAEEPEA